MVQGKALNRLSAYLCLDASVGTIKQVSAERARALQNLGISSVRDLLSFYPFRYVDMSQVRTIAQARIGEQCSLVAQVFEITKNARVKRATLLEVTLVDATGTLIMGCFNQPWLAKQVHTGDTLRVSGTVEYSYGFKRMTNPYWEKVEKDEPVSGLVLAVHSATAKLSRTIMARIIHNALVKTAGMYDPLPLSLREKYCLASRCQAFRMIHEPRSLQEVTDAKRRLIYEELFFLELHLLNERKQQTEAYTPYAQSLAPREREPIESLLPFGLTSDQRAAIDDILQRMGEPVSMNHLLLGDVGTGKTIVSLFALTAAARAGNQAVMIAPTEVLAWQYGTSLGPLLDKLEINWALLTGSTTADERQGIISGAQSGALQVLFGTHALLEDDVQFKRCSFVCFDEQQRFGVTQREALVAKAPGADVLSMTATPIPRSYALTLYGDISLSYLKQGPAQRKGRVTKVCHFSEDGMAYDALRACVARGEQAFIICPLIGITPSEHNNSVANNPEDNRSGDNTERIEYAAIEWGLESGELESTAKDVFAHARMIQQQIVPDARVEVLHGKLSSSEKNDIMNAFKAGDIDVLVSTTVVEVGVDVPRATVMIIEDADCFGLAQLHQLRGRVGRGNLPGQVFLISRSKAPRALERLEALEKTEDGFELSTYDLEQRKEGDILGVRQHGRPVLKLVNVVRDAAIIEAARNDAHELLYTTHFTDEEKALVFRELSVMSKRGEQ